MSNSPQQPLETLPLVVGLSSEDIPSDCSWIAFGGLTIVIWCTCWRLQEASQRRHRKHAYLHTWHYDIIITNRYVILWTEYNSDSKEKCCPLVLEEEQLSTGFYKEAIVVVVVVVFKHWQRLILWLPWWPDCCCCRRRCCRCCYVELLPYV